MAGSLSHITGKDGEFCFDLIENMGDAHEALAECFYIIRELSGNNVNAISDACIKLGYPDPYK